MPTQGQVNVKTSILKNLAALMLLAVSILLSGCGGGDRPLVEYSDTTLFVDGTAYERRTASEINGPGVFEEGAVYVTEQPGQQTALGARLDEFGLTHQYQSYSTFKVQVPTGWEDQWARAIQVQLEVKYTWLNWAITLDPGEIRVPDTGAIRME
jgi:hypothetical protein